MSGSISTFRIYLLRFLYLLNFVLLGVDVWPAIFTRATSWEPLEGVAFSFWGALSVLSAAGLRYPLKMLPLLLLQLAYKCIWLMAIAVPRWSVVGSTDLASAMLIGLVLDMIAIPWPYVLETFVRQPGDRWKSLSPKKG